MAHWETQGHRWNPCWNQEGKLQCNSVFPVDTGRLTFIEMNTHWDLCVFCGRVKLRGRLGLRGTNFSSASEGSRHLLFLNAAVTSELRPSRFFLLLKLLSMSEALLSLFFPLPGLFSSSDAFRCLDLSFSDLWKAVCIHLRLTLDSTLPWDTQK